MNRKLRKKLEVFRKNLVMDLEIIKLQGKMNKL